MQGETFLWDDYVWILGSWCLFSIIVLSSLHIFTNVSLKLFDKWGNEDNRQRLIISLKTHLNAIAFEPSIPAVMTVFHNSIIFFSNGQISWLNISFSFLLTEYVWHYLDPYLKELNKPFYNIAIGNLKIT